MTTTVVLQPHKISGSWFPTGYHGHFRSKSRNDLYGDYRQLAKPQPPRVFITRMKERPTSHVFSHHDNRFSFTTDATYLDMGVGKKRRIMTAFTNKPTRDLITWESAPRTDADFSIYKTSYRCETGPHPMPLKSYPSAQLTPKQEIAHDRRTSSYRYAFGGPRYNPNKDMIDALNHETLLAKPPSIRCITRSKSGRESVADCLIWESFTPSLSRPTTAVDKQTDSETITTDDCKTEGNKSTEVNTSSD